MKPANRQLDWKLSDAGTFEKRAKKKIGAEAFSVGLKGPGDV